MAQAVIDDLEVVEVNHQQRAAGLVALCRNQRLLGTVGEQQAVGQDRSGVMVNQARQLGLGVLDAEMAEKPARHNWLTWPLSSVIARTTTAGKPRHFCAGSRFRRATRRARRCLEHCTKGVELGAVTNDLNMFGRRPSTSSAG